MHSYYVYIYTHTQKLARKPCLTCQKCFYFGQGLKLAVGGVFPLYIVCTSQVLFQQQAWHWKDTYSMFGLLLKSNFLELMISWLTPLCRRGTGSLNQHCQTLCKFRTKALLYWSMQGKIWLVPWLTIFSTSSISFLPRGKVLFSFGLLIFLILSAAFHSWIWARQGAQACMLCKMWLSTSPPPLVSYLG